MGLLWDIVTVQRVSYNTENTRNKCKMPKANNCRQKTKKCVLFIIAFLLLCFYISDGALLSGYLSGVVGSETISTHKTHRQC